MSKKFYNSLGKTIIWPKIPLHSPTSLTYDDVLLIPQISKINSRKDVDLSVSFGPYKLKLPIISAPMDTITGEKMVKALASVGAIGCLPRNNFELSLSVCEKFTKEKIPCVYSISTKNAVEHAQKLEKAGAKVLLLDIAHGGITDVIKIASEIKRKTKLFVMTGNIATYSQALEYKKNKIDFARVGVGPGGLCTTRMITGSGFPQLSAIFETVSANIPVIADGGIKKPADVAKALAAGAKMVMVGSLFAGTEETPGEIIAGKKIARGQASLSYMADNGIDISEHRTAEGITTQVDAKGSVLRIIEEINGGLRSAFSYSNSKNIAEFQKNAIFNIVTHATTIENQAHINFNMS